MQGIVITSGNLIFIGSILLFLSIVAAKRAFQYGVPILLLFLAIGMLAGSDGIGKIRFDNPEVAQFIGIISLNFILFSGGLDTHWSTVRPILRQGLVLSTLGVLLTAVSLGLFVYWVTPFTIYESLLLGSIVSSTDAAAVFSILRSKSLALKSNLRPTLELESGSNDPMAYVLTISFLTLVVNQDMSFIEIIPIFLMQMLLGGMAGFFFGAVSRYVINSIQMAFEGLYPVLVIALMFITYSVTDLINGNGFLAIYICAVYLGNQELIHKKTILKVFDGYAWLMQIVLFLTLGLLVNPSQIIPYIGVGLLISGFLILVARPLSVFASLVFFRMRMRRRLYIAWVGLRGAVPIVFATYPLLAGIDKAEAIFNIVFFISVSSVVIQGTTLPIVARWLRVALPEKVKPISEVDKLTQEVARPIKVELLVHDASAAIDKKIIDMRFPKSSSIAMIKRNGEYITPSGGTRLNAGDVLLVLGDDDDAIAEVEFKLK